MYTMKYTTHAKRLAREGEKKKMPTIPNHKNLKNNQTFLYGKEHH